MKEYTWDEYYDKFYDWADSTREIHLIKLIDLGPASEIAEVINELSHNCKVAEKLLNRAINEKVSFDYYDLEILYGCCDSFLVDKALMNSGDNLNTDDIESLYGFTYEETLIDVCEKYGIKIPKVLEEYCDDLNDDYEDNIEENLSRQKSSGLFSILLGSLLGASSASNSKKKHTGKCDGNCSSCPPHYGYRYGRWYYGHHHIYGCEFDGNK